MRKQRTTEIRNTIMRKKPPTERPTMRPTFESRLRGAGREDERRGRGEERTGAVGRSGRGLRVRERAGEDGRVSKAVLASHKAT